MRPMKSKKTKMEELRNVKYTIHSFSNLNKIEFFIFILKLSLICSFESSNWNLNLFNNKIENKSMVSASATMLRIKEKKIVSDFMRKDLDKRRRKMIVD